MRSRPTLFLPPYPKSELATLPTRTWRRSKSDLARAPSPTWPLCKSDLASRSSRSRASAASRSSSGLRSRVPTTSPSRRARDFGGTLTCRVRLAAASRGGQRPGAFPPGPTAACAHSFARVAMDDLAPPPIHPAGAAGTRLGALPVHRTAAAVPSAMACRRLHTTRSLRRRGARRTGANRGVPTGQPGAIIARGRGQQPPPPAVALCRGACGGVPLAGTDSATRAARAARSGGGRGLAARALVGGGPSRSAARRDGRGRCAAADARETRAVRLDASGDARAARVGPGVRDGTGRRTTSRDVCCVGRRAGGASTRAVCARRLLATTSGAAAVVWSATSRRVSVSRARKPNPLCLPRNTPLLAGKCIQHHK